MEEVTRVIVQRRSVLMLKRCAVMISVISSILLFVSGCALFNSPPVASFVMSPTAGVVPLTVEFNASGSNDPDGSIATYEWDFGDGGNGAGVTIEHIFSTAGTYRITLTVTDNEGKIASATQELTVTPINSPLVASFVMSPIAGEAPLTVEFDASGSTDADGNIVTYEWDFGDGNSGTGVTIEHVFNAADTYTITLTVTDDQGKIASATQEITVAAGGSTPPPPPPPPAG